MYKALYSKYRPLTFDDVVSQSHITRTLSNQLMTGKTAHAYIFTGSRGTGKTTCARIFAKAINCMNPINGNPCLECEICKDAEKSALADIIEIDAASNGSVNDAREIKEAAEYLPERCRYKVYIIDEVHMLSPDAFNALLKLIEEPPSHVKFILATTEIHKVLPTILSRCQRFDFRRISPEDIKQRLLYVAGCENITLDEDAAELMAKSSDGGMRDALSLLDRCVAFSEHITAETVADAAGIAGRDYLFDILEAVAAKDAAKAVSVVQTLNDLSKDMQKLCEELIVQLRNVMIAKSVPDGDELLLCMTSERERIKNIAAQMSENDIFDKMDILQKYTDRIARASSKRIETEMCLIKLCTSSNAGNNAAAIDNSEIYAKIELLEKKISSAPAAQPVNDNRSVDYRSDYAPKQSAPVQTQAPVPQEKPVDINSLDPDKFTKVENWAEIFEQFSQACPSVSGALTGSYAMEQSGFMIIYSDNSFFLSLLKNKENSMKLMESIFNVTGQKYRVRAKYTGEKSQQDDNPVQKLLDKAKESGVPTESN